MKHLIIVGAGFSYNVGLPLATGFTKQLLDVAGLKPSGPSAMLVKLVQHFVDDAFNDGFPLKPEEWPVLEDLFTTIDLSANSGHNLGPNYSPSYLRTIRRALIVRLIRMLAISFRSKARSPDKNFQNVSKLMAGIRTEQVGFLSMNWDAVIEQMILDFQGAHSIDYGCGAIAAQFAPGSIKLKAGRRPVRNLTILKPHGSTNWMYCEACSRLFWFPPTETEKVAQKLFHDSDRAVAKHLIGARFSSSSSPSACPYCSAQALGTRFATFSYRKALEFPMHQATWSRAEELLQAASNWIFIGYSMPAADYQFKHMLKRVQLSRQKRPRIILITKAPPDDTIENYKRFFSPQALAPGDILKNGVDDKAVARLRGLGALR